MRSGYTYCFNWSDNRKNRGGFDRSNAGFESKALLILIVTDCHPTLNRYLYLICDQIKIFSRGWSAKHLAWKRIQGNYKNACMNCTNPIPFLYFPNNAPLPTSYRQSKKRNRTTTRACLRARTQSGVDGLPLFIRHEERTPQGDRNW